MLLFVIETDINNDSEDEEVVLEEYDSVPHRKESKASQKNCKKEQESDKRVGKTITEETTETGTVSCRDWKGLNFCEEGRKLCLVVLKTYNYTSHQVLFRLLNCLLNHVLLLFCFRSVARRVRSR